MLEHLQVAFFHYGINPLVTWAPNRTEQMLIRLVWRQCSGGAGFKAVELLFAR